VGRLSTCVVIRHVVAVHLRVPTTSIGVYQTSMATQAPFGTWKSPIGADLIIQKVHAHAFSILLCLFQCISAHRLLISPKSSSIQKRARSITSKHARLKLVAAFLLKQLQRTIVIYSMRNGMLEAEYMSTVVELPRCTMELRILQTYRT
jgi:hypothetical protein